MIRQSQAIVLLVWAAIGTGCGSDKVVGPAADTAVFVRVEPAQASLFTTGQQSSVQLTVEVLDLRGALFRGPYSVAYSSSAPGIARVSEEGVVTAVASGSAAITTTVTSGGAARVATTPVTVAANPIDYWRIAGTYDLTAAVTMHVESWGEDWSAYQYIGALTFPGPDAGTFTDARLLDEGGEPRFSVNGGSITLDVPTASGLFALRLGADWVAVVESVEQPGEDALSSPLIKGTLTGKAVNTFGTWWLSGPFVATLRGSELNAR